MRQFYHISNTYVMKLPDTSSKLRNSLSTVKMTGEAQEVRSNKRTKEKKREEREKREKR